MVSYIIYILFIFGGAWNLYFAPQLGYELGFIFFKISILLILINIIYSYKEYIKYLKNYLNIIFLISCILCKEYYIGYYLLVALNIRKKSKKKLLQILFFSYIFIGILTFILYKFDLLKIGSKLYYKNGKLIEIFTILKVNPNSIAITLINFLMILVFINKKNKILHFLLTIGIFIVLKSRTFLIMSLSIYFFYYLVIKIKKRFIKYIVLFSMCLWLIILKYSYILEGIISRRNIFWKMILENSKLYGNTILKIEIPIDNMYIFLIGKNGYIFTVIFLFYILNLLKNYIDNYKLLVILYFIIYLIYSNSESLNNMVFFNSIVVIFLVYSIKKQNLRRV